MLAELERGILETTGLAAAPAGPGLIAIRCESPRMAAWLCAAIILENVDARVEGDAAAAARRPRFPARGPGEERDHGGGQDAPLLARAPGDRSPGVTGDTVVIAGLPARD